jgi:hypothetical protein
MASKKNVRIFPDGGITVVDLGTMEIWDGADMAMLRESFVRLVKREKRRAIGIEMSHVKYIPSGFFGMLFDWYEVGVKIRLYDALPHVRRMLWFSRFFEPVAENCYELRPQRALGFPPGFGSEEPTSPPGTPQNGSTVAPRVVAGR